MKITNFILLTALFQIPFLFSQNFEEQIIARSGNWYEPIIIDIDNDGIEDLVSISGDGSIAWWKKDANSNYTKIIIDETPKIVNDFDVIDIDGDNDLDILLSRLHTIEVYYNDGNQNFNTTYTQNNGYSSNIIAKGDFDGNGYNDFITTSRASNAHLKVWYRNPTANFSSSNIRQVPISTEDIVVDDIDNDGDLDLIMSVSSSSWTENHILCYLNDGFGNFTEHLINYTLTNRAIRILDYNDDGNKDFVVKRNTPSGGIILFSNDGNLNFTENTVDANDPKVADLWNSNFDMTSIEDTFISPNSFTSFDIDKDGFKDVISTSSAENELVLWHNQGGLNFTKNIIDNTASLIRSSDVVDFNNDGLNDIIVSTYQFGEGKVYLYTNEGNFNFTKSILLDVTGVQKVIVEDVNNDGYFDLLYTRPASNNGQIYAYVNDGNSNFTSQFLATIEDWLVVVSYADVNNDGYKDLITDKPNIDNPIYFKNDGNLNFTKTSLPARANFFDIDGDNDLDFISSRFDYTESKNFFSWYENDGSGNFTEHVIFTHNTNSGDEITIQDFDGDGDIDFVSVPRNEYASQGISFWENNGNQVFTKSTVNNDYKITNHLLNDDYDNDGDMDVLTSSTKFPFTIWQNKSDTALFLIESEKKIVFISPNPTKNNFSIQTKENIFKVIIYDALGKKITTFKNTKNIEMSNLPKGIYFAHIFSNKKHKEILKVLKI